MDYDRKSTVSSFYGGRRSGDALNANFPAGAAPPARPRVESTSSFYGDRNSRADVYDHTPAGAGYNQTSFFAAGRTEPVKGDGDRDEEAAWDIYADFNNAGPKYSSAFGMGDNGSYRQVPSPTPYSPQTPGFAKESAASLAGEQQPGGVEMVTVPALGPEWKADELHDMSKKAKREEKMENISSKWKAWNRGQTGLCGRYFTRRFTAWFVFGLCVAIGLVLAFTIPRVPAFSTNQIEPISSATLPFNKTVPTEFSRSPANFSFPGMMKLQADTGGNFLPLTFNNIHGTVFDLTTGRQIATGDTGHLTVPAKQFPVVNLNLNFTYAAVNDSDITWNNWYNACKNKAVVAGGIRPSVQFRLLLDLDIAGLIGKHSASTEVTDGACPIELPTNSV